MGSIIKTSECSGLFYGNNCTETWKEVLDPWYSILTYLWATLFGIAALNIFMIWLETVRGKRLTTLPVLRFMLVGSALASAVLFTVFYGLGGNVAYGLNDWKGIICIIAHNLATACFFQATNFLAVMYVGVLQKSLTNKGLLKYTLPVKYLRWFAIPWVYYAVVIVGFFAFIFVDKEEFEQKEDVLLYIRITYSAQLYLLFMSVTVNAYYFRELGMALRDAIQKTAHNEDAKALYAGWKKLSVFALRSYWISVVGGVPFFLYGLIAVILDLNSNPYVYFFTQFCLWAPGILLAQSLFILEFREGNIFSTMRCFHCGTDWSLTHIGANAAAQENEMKIERTELDSSNFYSI